MAEGHEFISPSCISYDIYTYCPLLLLFFSFLFSPGGGCFFSFFSFHLSVFSEAREFVFKYFFQHYVVWCGVGVFVCFFSHISFYCRCFSFLPYNPVVV